MGGRCSKRYKTNPICACPTTPARPGKNTIPTGPTISIRSLGSFACAATITMTCRARPGASRSTRPWDWSRVSRLPRSDYAPGLPPRKAMSRPARISWPKPASSWKAARSSGWSTAWPRQWPRSWKRVRPPAPIPSPSSARKWMARACRWGPMNWRDGLANKRTARPKPANSNWVLFHPDPD